MKIFNNTKKKLQPQADEGADAPFVLVYRHVVVEERIAHGIDHARIYSFKIEIYSS